MELASGISSMLCLKYFRLMVKMLGQSHASQSLNPGFLTAMAQKSTFLSPVQSSSSLDLNRRLLEREFSTFQQKRLRNSNRRQTQTVTHNISSFQSSSALISRCITRARTQTSRLKLDPVTHCKFPANDRIRLEPPLPQDYFGNCIQLVEGSTTAGELLEQGLGWAALMLHQAVVSLNDKAVRDLVDKWLQSPNIYQTGQLVVSECVLMGSSPRFNMYGNEFGMGKGIALRSGYANKFDGKVTSYQGYEVGSIDLEVCLQPDSMAALESDEEFMDAISLPHYLR